MASERFEDIIQGCIPDFQLQWPEVRYRMRDAEEFVENHPACGRCIRLGIHCGRIGTDEEIPTTCFACYKTSTRCRRTVEFMATMLSRTTLQPVQDIIEEWEAELTHPRELHQKVIELKAALEERDELLRRKDIELEEKTRELIELKAALEEREGMLVRKDIELEEQKKRVATLVRISADSDKELEVLDDKNKDLTQKIYELEEDLEREKERLASWMFPNRGQS